MKKMSGRNHAQTVQTTAPNSPAFATVNGNATDSYVNQQTNNSYAIVASPDTRKLNVLQRHQNALLVAENPTKLKLVDAKFMLWGEDKEEYLTLVFRNASKLPAYELEFGTFDPRKTGKSSKLQFLKFTPSSVVHKNVKLHYSVDGGAEHVAPLISVSELKSILEVLPKYCVVLARVLEGARSFPPLPQKPGAAGGWDLTLPITFTYWSIFEQKYLANSGVSIIVTQRDKLIPPGPNRNDEDVRCHDENTEPEK